MAEDALAVLDAASAASAHVYGVSLGGAIALQLALDHPGRVRSLILGCTAASAEGVPRGALVIRVRSLLPAAALNRMAWKLLYGPGTRRGNPAGSRLNDLDRRVMAISPAWMADEEAPASGVTNDSEMK